MFKVFNPNGTDKKDQRQIFAGNSTGIINLNNVKYEWAIQLWRQMRENFWIAEKIDLSMDVVTYNQLTPEEKRAFDGILAYLVFLDSVQVSNIPHIVRPCTAPEVSLCFGEQLSQEQLHSQSYQYIIESIIPPEKRDDIYEYWREDEILLNRCKLIGDYYQSYIDNPTEETYTITLIADYILEGIFFYTGFAFFYSLASRSLMCGCADIFRMINRDELSHVRLYQKLIQEKMKSKFKDLIEFYVKDMMQEAVNAEIKWSEHIIGENILGMPLSAVSEYIKYLANTRLKAVGVEPIYDNPKNRFKHLERIADTSKDAHVKQNFFDGTVTSYQMSSTLEEWDF